MVAEAERRKWEIDERKVEREDYRKDSGKAGAEKAREELQLRIGTERFCSDNSREWSLEFSLKKNIEIQNQLSI